MNEQEIYRFRITPEAYLLSLLGAVFLSGIILRLVGLSSVTQLADIALYAVLTVAAVGRVRDIGASGLWALAIWLPIGVWLLPLAASWQPTWHSEMIMLSAAIAAAIHFALAFARSDLLR